MKEKTEGIFIRVPKSLLKKIEAWAQKERRTRQNWILNVLSEKCKHVK